MTPRFLVYPLLLLTIVQALPLVRRDTRQRLTELIPLIVIAGLAVAALWLPHPGGWLAAGWGLFFIKVVLPRGLLWLGDRSRQREQWSRAAGLINAAGSLIGGRTGRLQRHYARALHKLQWNDPAAAEQILEEILHPSLSPAERGTVWLWKLQLLTQLRAWAKARDWFEAAPDWGTLWVATQARLHAARAYAELGEMVTALKCLQHALLSPVVVRLTEPVWALRVRLAAMAGDATELERLLTTPQTARRGFARFAAYWRGRCALASGDREVAIRHLARAYAITDPRDRGWLQAVRYHLLLAEDEDTTPTGTVSSEYDQELAALHRAEAHSAPWRNLMTLGRPPLLTLILLSEIAAVYLVQAILPVPWENRLIILAGNGTFTIGLGQWWRLWTAIFLHAGWLHLAMNGLALWMFGSAIERTAGWWRMLVIFLMGGAAGNLLSASVERYDIAVGASSGIFALLGAYGVALLRLPNPLYTSLRTRLIRMLFLLVAVDFTIGWLEPQVDNLAHIGGFLAGATLAALIARPGKRHS